MFLMTKAFAAGMRSAPLGPHRQHRIGHGQPGDAELCALHHQQDGRDRVYPRHRQRVRARWRDRQRDRARIDAHARHAGARQLARREDRRKSSSSSPVPIHPIPRVGTPDDMVGTLSYLTSDDAAYVTGQTIFVCGGLVTGVIMSDNGVVTLPSRFSVRETIDRLVAKSHVARPQRFRARRSCRRCCEDRDWRCGRPSS